MDALLRLDPRLELMLQNQAHLRPLGLIGCQAQDY